MWAGRGMGRSDGGGRPFVSHPTPPRQAEADPDRSQRLLAERARSPVRPLVPPSRDGAIEIVTFALGSERYALEARYLQSVFRLHDLVPIPGAPPPVFGITTWRGELLTVLDLRELLNVAARGLSDLNHVLVLGERKAAFGILADAIMEMLTLPTAAIRPPAEGVAVRREYLRGITADTTLFLDAAEILQLHG